MVMKSFTGRQIPVKAPRCLSLCLCSNLSSNHLSRLEESSFSGLSLLQELHAGHNRVSFIADGAFRGLSNLQTL